MGKFFKAFGNGLGFLGIYIGASSIASLIIGVPIMVGTIMELMNQGGISVEEITIIAIRDLLEAALLITIVTGVIALLIYFLIFKGSKKNVLEEVNIRPINLKSIPFLILGGVALNFFISLILNLLPQEMIDAYSQSASLISGSDAMVFIATVIMAPIVEEVMCRGLIQSRFQKGMPTAVAIILQGVIFGALHGQILWIAYATLLGVIFGVIAHRQNSILGAIILHFAVNGSSFVLGLFGFDFEVHGTLMYVILAVSAILSVVSIVAILKMTPYSKNATVGNNELDDLQRM